MTTCKKCAHGVPHEIPHGACGYQYHRCRCDVCKETKRQKAGEEYRRNRERYIGYTHQYYDAHRDEILEKQRNSTPAKRKARRGYNSQYYDANREATIARAQEYYDANRDEIRRKSREHYARTRESAIHRARKNRTKLQRIPAPRNKSPWTPEDDAVVLSDRTVGQMCRVLGRSAGSVRWRREVLTYGPGGRPRGDRNPQRREYYARNRERINRRQREYVRGWRARRRESA